MKEISKRDVYQHEINRLIRIQNMPPLPPCPFDGDPCLTPERGCECVSFGIMKGKLPEWRCERMDPKKPMFSEYIKKRRRKLDEQV